MYSNTVAKVKRFRCAIPHKGGMASLLFPAVVVVGVAVVVAMAVSW